VKTLTRRLRNSLGNAFKTLKLFNTYRGVFETFAQARQAAPKAKPVGYDQPCVASWYKQQLTSVKHDDYPALFWMSKALASGSSVYEIGGHVGLAFYGFERYLRYPSGLKWTICDVPSVITEGRRLAREHARGELMFVSDPDGFDGADIVLAAGSLQYVESPDLADMIEAFSRKPQHVIVNKTPVWNGPRFVTLQNLGCSHCPYLVRNRQHFIASMEALDYQLVDTWEKERCFRILRHPDKAFDHYSGFYFRRGS
jgi:putative methyltransferase (TIGR04325 family)